MKDACLFAINRTIERMLGVDTTPESLLRAFTGKHKVKIATGINGLTVFHEDFLSWRANDDWQKTVRYTSNCFEKYGTGGGNFRRLYAKFLESAQTYLPEVVDEQSISMTKKVADEWTMLTHCFNVLTEQDSEQSWHKCHAQIGNILNQEIALYKHLEKRLKNAS